MVVNLRQKPNSMVAADLNFNTRLEPCLLVDLIHIVIVMELNELIPSLGRAIHFIGGVNGFKNAGCSFVVRYLVWSPANSSPRWIFLLI
jgi:hypothetical protein